MCLLVALTFGGWMPAIGAALAGSSGTVRLELSIPDGSTALIEIAGVNVDAHRTVVHHSTDGDVVEVPLPGGTYRITPRAMYHDGTRYVAAAAPGQINVRANDTAGSTIYYAPSKGVQNLRVVDLTETSVELDWDAELGDDTTVWRTLGSAAPTRPGEGTEVPVHDSSIVDMGLAAGATYSYSIFARPGDGAFGRDDVDPVSITIGTVPESGAVGQPFFVLSPQAKLLDADHFAATPTGDGLRLDLSDSVSTPVPGTILVLPSTSVLPGGYIGGVVGVSDDGRSVELVFAPMASAFDLYHLSVPNITAVPDLAPAAQASAAASEAAGTQAAPKAAASALQSCLGGAVGVDVNTDLGISHGGYADVTIDTYGVLFVGVPTGVTFDVGYTATLTGTVDIEGSAGVKCQVPLPEFTKNVTLVPVPLVLSVRPAVEVNLTASGSVENLGFAATGGFAVDGHMALSGGFDFNGDVINNSEPTQPTATGTIEVGVDIGGELNFGPGVGVSKAGVLIGIGGDLFLVDSTLAVKAVDDGTGTATCIEYGVATSMGIYATLRAWVPGFEADYKYTIDALQGEFPWGGSPYHWPDDCTGGDIPTDDVVGHGVTVIDDSVSGSSEQFGKVPGLVAGEDTWVLSTGRIDEVVGSPGFFASTGLGGTGDADLTALSGYTTYDAVAYSVTVIPNANTLYVQYAFASEEYPEFVGSVYNDVMAIFVDGQNCALVPGTQTPVSINTINHDVNSSYYIDNTSGASGYGTSMDGLTVPLTCSVPVEPGEPVEVKIAVADASDAAYDSAIALLDEGIYSE